MSAQPLLEDGDWLTTADGAHRYPVVDGIPCLIGKGDAATHRGLQGLLEQNGRVTDATIDLDVFMEGMIVPTCGNLFHGVKLRDAYPIPDFPAEIGLGMCLDVGCNWGRWSIAGALGGRTMVGVDVHLESLFVARRLAAKLTPDNPPLWVLADGRRLPFAPGAFDGAFSYSVIQHFSRANARRILGEMGRVLRRGGRAVVQMPNRDGIKTLITMPRRRLSEGSEFDVRYYGIGELTDMFRAAIGPATWAVDCFLGLNVHAKDRPLVPRSRRWVIDVAEALKGLSRIAAPFGRLSDSVWVRAEKA